MFDTSRYIIFLLSKALFLGGDFIGRVYLIIASFKGTSLEVLPNAAISFSAHLQAMMQGT